MTNPRSPWQTCVLSNGTGLVATSNVTSIAVNCTTSTYTVGGTVSGLGNGDSIVLRNNGADPVTVSANGSFVFPAAIASGASYTVSTTSPSSPVAQTCTVSSGSGSVTNGNVTSVAINCATSTYRVGGTVTGLVGGGLVLSDSAGDNIAITDNGAFSFPTRIASNSATARRS